MITLRTCCKSCRHHAIPSFFTAVHVCSQRWRETSEETRHRARLQDDMINEIRQAAEVHRQVGLPQIQSSFLHLQPSEVYFERSRSSVGFTQAVQAPQLPQHRCE